MRGSTRLGTGSDQIAFLHATNRPARLTTFLSARHVNAVAFTSRGQAATHRMEANVEEQHGVAGQR
jgi:hypothetical protein